MARKRKPPSNYGGGRKGRDGSDTSTRKKPPQLEKERELKTRPKRNRRDNDEDTSSEDDHEEVREVVKPHQEKSISDDDYNIPTSEGDHEKTIDEDSDEDAKIPVSMTSRLEQDNLRLRKKIRRMQEEASKGGGDNQLNTVQQTLLGTYVKETLFRKAKFVDHRKLNSASNIMQLCFTSIGLTGEEGYKYSSGVKKLLRHYLSQRRNYVAQQLKKCVMGKFPPVTVLVHNDVLMHNILFL